LIGKMGVELCDGDVCSCSLVFLHVLLVSVFNEVFIILGLFLVVS
jgi:hypothetical protein